MSMLMPFSASTIRVRWLHGSAGAENSVMMDRRLDKCPAPAARVVATPARHPRPSPRSVHVLPVLPLHQPREPGEDEQKQHHPHAQRTPRGLRRFADVIEKVDGVAHEALVFGRAETPGCERLEVVEHLLADRLAALAGHGNLAE